MDTARAWLNKLKSIGKEKSSKKKETSRSNVKEGSKTVGGEEAVSNVTKQKAAAAKQYIENHYKKQVQSQQQRKERYGFVTYFKIKLSFCSLAFSFLTPAQVSGIHMSVSIILVLMHGKMEIRQMCC